MNNLFTYTLRIADNTLVLAQRLSEWTGHGPFLEEDLALTNVALDTFGTATSLLEYAAQIEGKGRSADDLAYFRNERVFAYVLLGYPKHLALTILFGAGAILSHPQTALHAVLGGAVLFGFYGRSKRGVLSAVAVGFGVVFLTAPWWGNVLLRHGLEPLLSAGQTSQRTIEVYLIVLNLHGSGNFLAIPMLIFFYIGLRISIRQKNFFFIAWIVLAYSIDTRGGDSIALLPEAMLAGMGLLKLDMLINRSNDERHQVPKRASSSLAPIRQAVRVLRCDSAPACLYLRRIKKR